MTDFPEKLAQKLEQRKEENALRLLSTSVDLVDFSSNDYLGFSRNETIADEASQFLKNTTLFQNGATASRLLSGNHSLFEKLEGFLADFHQSEAALVFNSGYDANLGFFSSVPQRDDIIFYDEWVHASIRDGIKMGNAKAYKFRHNDLDDLQMGIERSRNAQSKKDVEAYIVTESVFSMDGDTPNLVGLANFCYKNDLHLIVDEAHATGIFGGGKGLVAQLGIQDQVFARLMTFGKAMGCHGAAILGNQELKSYLVNFARSLIYTTALPPSSLATILAGYKYLDENGEPNQKRLFENIDFFKDQITVHEIDGVFIKSDSAIQSAIIPGNEKVKAISKKIGDAGFDVRPILSPTVPKGSERLRFCLHAFNTKEEIQKVLQIFADECAVV